MSDTELLESFYLECVARGLRPKSIDNYAERLRVFTEFQYARGKTLAGTIREDITHFITNALRQQLSRYTINGRLGAIRAFFNFLTDPLRHPDGPPLRVNPMTGIRMLHTDVRRPLCLTATQINQVLALFDSRHADNQNTPFLASRNRNITLVMYDTMLRPGEVVNLLLDDIDLRPKSGGMIYVRTAKDHQDRRVPLHPAVARSLHAYLHRFRTDMPGEHVFCYSHGGPMTVDRLTRMYYTIGRRLGFRVTAYMFRHSGATGYCQRGGSIEILQDIMGHSDIRITRRYVHSNEDITAQRHIQCSAVNLLSLTSSGRHQ